MPALPAMKYAIIAIVAYALYQANQPASSSGVPSGAGAFSGGGNPTVREGAGTPYGNDYIRPPKRISGDVPYGDDMVEIPKTYTSWWL